MYGNIGVSFSNYYFDSLTDRSSFMILYINYDEGDYRSSDISYLSGANFVSSYSTGLTGSSSKSFKSFFEKKVSYSLEINEEVENAYAGIYLYLDGLTKTSEYLEGEWPDNEHLRLALVGITVQGPSGSIQIKNNNYCERVLYIMMITQYGGYSQIFPTSSDLHIIPQNYVPSECMNVKKTKYYKMNIPIFVVTIVFTVINVINIIYTLIVIIRHRNHKIFRAFTTENHYFTLLGLLLFSFFPYTVLSLTKGESQFMCDFSIVYAYTSMVILFSPLAHKTIKVCISAKKGRIRKLQIKPLYTLIVLVLQFIIEIIILSIWLTTSPPGYEEVIFEGGSDYFTDMIVGRCTVNNWKYSYLYYSLAIIIIYLVLWFIISSISYYYRKAGNRYGDTFSLSLANIAITFLGGFFSLFSYVSRDNPEINDGMMMIGSEVTVYITFFALLGHIFFFIFILVF